MSVYFIQASDGAVKIGRAEDVSVRLRNLQTAHARELTVIRVIDGDFAEERECQAAFKDAHIRGEWFEFQEEMLTYQPTGLDGIGLLPAQDSCLSDAADTLVGFMRKAVMKSPLKQRQIAQMMGYSPSRLSRKLRQNPNDSSRLTLDDFERYVQVTNDTQPILYLVEKYLTKESAEEIQRQIAALQQKLQGAA